MRCHGALAAVAALYLAGCSAATAFMMQGERALAARDYQRAAQAFSLALVENPQHVGALTALGVTYYRQEAFEAAIDALERAQAIAPADGQIRFYLGLAYLRQGQLDAARQQLAAFLERPRSRAIAEHTLRALTLLEEASLSEGVRDYIAYSLETAVQQEERTEVLRERVRALEAERYLRPYPLVLRPLRKR
jgi:tetratricopeptide (TPR) repeat protein